MLVVDSFPWSGRLFYKMEKLMDKWTLQELLASLPVNHRPLAERLIKDISALFTLVWSGKSGSTNGRREPGFRAFYHQEGKNYRLIEYGTEGDVLLKFFKVSSHPPFDKGTDTLIHHFLSLMSITKSRDTGKISLESLLDENHYSQFMAELRWFIQVINNPEIYFDSSVLQGNKSAANFSDPILPNFSDFEAACRMIARLGEEVSIDSVLDQIESNALQKGWLLKSNWRLITEKNIEIWSEIR